MQKLYQQIAESVLSSIQDGTYQLGQRLPPERDLADKFGVSRPTVREAMIALEIRGVVEARHGSGVYVTEAVPPGASASGLDIGAFELTEARCLFEGEAAALAATSITDEELETLEAVILEMAEENAKGIHGELADQRFHLIIAQATRNSAIVNVIENLWNVRINSPLCVNMLQRAREVGVQPRIDEHRAIIDALKAHNPTAARKAMRQHLRRVIEALLAATEMQALQQARSQIEAKRSEYARRAAV